MSPELPPKVPGVELDACIGVGGMASVWRGVWKGRPVAVKVLQLPAAPHQRQRFLREGRLLLRLRHPNLVTCHAVHADDPPALVLELADGLALDRRIAREPLSGAHATALARAMLDALGHLHIHGVVHRDVKPANIFVADDGRFLLMDLGLAADVGEASATPTGEVTGTYAYMAPEQLAGGMVDHRADLYALGITLYEAVTGLRPYHGRGVARWLVAHRMGGARPVSELAPGTPTALVGLIERLMARDPTHRPASAAAALALLNGADGLPSLSIAPLVGRAGAIGAIHAVVDGGGVLRVRGEVGSGVGAILDKAREIAQEARREVISVRCRPKTQVQAVAAAVARELEGVGERVEPSPFFVAAALRASAATAPIVLIVVDLDVAGPEVGPWLDDLAAIPGLALIVGGFRLPPVPRGRELRLRALEAGEIRELVAAMLGTSAIPPGLDLRLASITGGLPGLLVPALRDLVARGAVWKEQGPDATSRWRWDASVRNIGRFDAVQLFERGHAQLGDDARKVLELLAVASTPLPVDVVLRAAELPAAEPTIGRLSTEGLVRVERRGDEDWLTLRRGYLESALTDRLPEEARRGRHAALAQALLDLGTSAPWARVARAVHEAWAHGDRAAVVRVIDIADQFARVGRADSAMELLGRLPPTVGGSPEESRVNLIRAESLLALGRISDGDAALASCVALSAEGGRDFGVRVVVLRADRALVAGTDPAEARLLLAPHLRGLGSPQALLVAAELAFRQGELVDARELLDRARRHVAAPRGDRFAWRGALLDAELLRLSGPMVPAAGRLADLETELHSGPLTRERVQTLAMLAGWFVQTGEARLALDAAASAETLAADLPSPTSRAWAAVARIAVDRWLGLGTNAGTRVVGLEPFLEGDAPYALKAEIGGVTADVRLAAGDRPGALAAHVAAGELAHAAGHVERTAWHEGMAALFTADSASLDRAVTTLETLGSTILSARLSFEAGRQLRDTRFFLPAEAAARAADARLVLLDILHYARGERAREEAESLATGVLARLEGTAAAAFRRLPAVVWALDRSRDGALREG